MGKTQPGITIDENIWKKFKKKFNENASVKVEELMRSCIESEEIPKILPAENIESLTLGNANTWSINYNNNNLSIMNTAFNCSSSCSYSSDGSSGTGDFRNIKIE
jgi:hypothetical protein